MTSINWVVETGIHSEMLKRESECAVDTAGSETAARFLFFHTITLNSALNEFASPSQLAMPTSMPHRRSPTLTFYICADLQLSQHAILTLCDRSSTPVCRWTPREDAGSDKSHVNLPRRLLWKKEQIHIYSRSICGTGSNVRNKSSTWLQRVGLLFCNVTDVYASSWSKIINMTGCWFLPWSAYLWIIALFIVTIYYLTGQLAAISLMC